MATSRRGFIHQGRSKKRLTNWGSGPGGTAINQISASSSLILGAGVTFGAAGTVVRIRGWLSLWLSSYTTASDGFQGAVGIGLASETVFDAGIASLPTPITEEAWDGWLWHQYFGIYGGLAAGSTAVGVTAGDFGVPIDSKAMRKVSDQMVIYAALEGIESGAAVLNITLDSRMLLKEG